MPSSLPFPGWENFRAIEDSPAPKVFTTTPVVSTKTTTSSSYSPCEANGVGTCLSGHPLHHRNGLSLGLPQHQGYNRLVPRQNPVPGSQISANHHNQASSHSTEPGSGSLVQALAPDSYSLREEDESFGITWYRQQVCPNYHRYLKKSLVRVEALWLEWYQLAFQ